MSMSKRVDYCRTDILEIFLVKDPELGCSFQWFRSQHRFREVHLNSLKPVPRERPSQYLGTAKPEKIWSRPRWSSGPKPATGNPKPLPRPRQ